MADNNLFELSGTVELDTSDFEKSAEEVSRKLDDLLIKLVSVESQAKKTFKELSVPNNQDNQPGQTTENKQENTTQAENTEPEKAESEDSPLDSIGEKILDQFDGNNSNGFPKFELGDLDLGGTGSNFFDTAAGTFVGNLASDGLKGLGNALSGKHSVEVDVVFPDAETMQNQLNEIVAENPLFVPVNAVLQYPEQKTETEEIPSEVVENEHVLEHVQMGPLTNEDYEKIEGDRYSHPKWTREYGFFTPKLDSDQWSAAIGGREFIYPHVGSSGNSDGFIGLTLDDYKRINKNPDIYKNVRNEQDLFYNLNNYLPFTYSPGDTVPVTDIGSGGVNDLLPWLQEKFPDFNFEIVPEIPEEAEENLQSSLNGFSIKLPVTPVISGSLGGYDWGDFNTGSGSEAPGVNLGAELKNALSGMSVTIDDRVVGVMNEKLGSNMTGWG